MNARALICGPRGARQAYGVKPRSAPPPDLLVKLATATFVGNASASSRANAPGLGRTLAALYARDADFHRLIALHQRAASDPATTTAPEWAGELSRQAVADFMDILAPISAWPALAARGVEIEFGTNSSVKIPGRAKDPSLAGDFILEGDPIPVRQMGMASITLEPRKLAVISTFSREIAKNSTPAIEGLIRSAMIEDTAAILDARLFDAEPASRKRPAGLLNGATEIPPADTGNPLANFTADMRNLVAAIMPATGGQRRDICVIVNVLDAMSISLLERADGEFAFTDLADAGARFGVSFLTSVGVAEGTCIAVDAADFASAIEDAPEFDISNQATLHMEDTSPQPIVDGAGTAAPGTRSLWQTDSIGIRGLWPICWAMRRQGCVAFMNGVNWS